jgi:membrane-bound lytic murein transglycosylase D
MRKRILLSQFVALSLVSVNTTNAQLITSGIPTTGTATTTTTTPASVIYQSAAPIVSVSSYALPEELTDASIMPRLQNIQGSIEMTFNDIVRNYIYAAVNRRSTTEIVLARSTMYMNIFEQYLAAYNLPRELKYLPVIESALNPKAVSPAGAAGLWQFMPSAGTQFGLKIDRFVDERFDAHKSSEAAAKFLSYLYNKFGDWQLAIAAYNCGPARVEGVINQMGGVRNYWYIYDQLPRETRGYVPAFIAANYIMNYHEVHRIYAASLDNNLTNTETVTVYRAKSFQKLSQESGVPMDILQTLNPSFRRGTIPSSEEGYRITLPLSGYISYRNLYPTDDYATPVMIAASEQAAIEPIVNQTPTAETTVVNKKKVEAVAAKTVSAKKELNKKPIAKETKNESKINSGKEAAKGSTYEIKNGDSIYKIAKKTGKTMEEIKQLNGFNNNSHLTPGASIKINSGIPNGKPATAKKKKK